MFNGEFDACCFGLPSASLPDYGKVDIALYGLKNIPYSVFRIPYSVFRIPSGAC
ncbi:hypothetical protein QTO01_07920 [Vibrio mytili]|uniref:hypothetical protein n=1 Tax=Vibrio mytili TaxID=50718 RepID=UPI002F40F178